MKSTTKQKLIAGILKMGGKPVNTGSRKYEAYEIPSRPDALYFVGKCGALRAGRSASDSWSIGAPGGFCSPLYKRLLSEGETAVYIQAHQPKAAA